MKVFIDSDVIIDLFAQREPYYKYSAKLFSLIDNGKIEGFASALIFSNLFYILRKLKSKSHAKNILLKLKMLVTILPINDKIIDLALTSDFIDFEDSIQYYVAKEYNISTLITRNIKDYKKAEINVFTAEEFLRIQKL